MERSRDRTWLRDDHASGLLTTAYSTNVHRWLLTLKPSQTCGCLGSARLSLSVRISLSKNSVFLSVNQPYKSTGVKISPAEQAFSHQRFCFFHHGGSLQ